MSDDRDKLLKIMSSLEADYNSGKISREKYSYFRSKYEDKLNSIDAVEATRRIRSMQGKSTAPKNRKRSRKPTVDKKKQEQDLVQKYIINPKKGDAKYNKKKKSSMDGNTFKLMAVLVLVIAFTAGVAYGVFSFEFDTGAETGVVAIVEDTAFPEIKAVVNTTTTNSTDTSNNTQVEDTSDDNDDKVETTTTETTTTTTTETTTDTSTDSGSSSTGGGGSSDSGSSSTGGGGSSDSGSSSDSGGGSSESGDGGEE